MGCGNFQFLSVLRDRSPRQYEILVPQYLHHLSVAEWASRVLRLNDFTNSLFNRNGRNVFSMRVAQAAMKKIFHFTEALRRVHVFITYHPAYRRLVHIDVVGDGPQYQRVQMLNSEIEKFALKLNQTIGHLLNGFLSLLHRFNKPYGRV